MNFVYYHLSHATKLSLSLDDLQNDVYNNAYGRFHCFHSNLNPVQIVTVNLYREADIKKKKKDKNTKIGMLYPLITGPKSLNTMIGLRQCQH